MAFQPSQKVLLPLLLVSLPLLAAEHPSVAPGPAQLPGQWKTYRATGVPFEFSYPGTFLLDAHVNPKLGFIFALMKKPDTPWLIDIDFADRADFSMPPYSQMSFEEFAIARARVGCDADGPDGSVHCSGVTRKKVWRNRNGLDVVEFYLDQVNKRYNPPKTTRSVVGPVVALRLPTGKSGQVLTFKRTESGQSGLDGGELLRQIAESVKLAR